MHCIGAKFCVCVFLESRDKSLNMFQNLSALATAQCNYTTVSSFVCGFLKLFWIPQIQLRIPQVRLFFKYLFVESKTAKKIKEK